MQNESSPPHTTNDSSEDAEMYETNETDLRFLALRMERKRYLLALIQTARTEMAPRNFAERHLVDEMAIAKWRGLRTVFMEKLVYDCQDASPLPGTSDATGRPSTGFDQQAFHVAAAHSATPHAVILAALSRLDARFHQQFCSALRHFQSLRRQNPFAPTFPVQILEINDETETEIRKEEPICSPSH